MRKPIAALLVLAVLGAPACNGTGNGDVSSDRPPNERRPDPKATRIVFITANSTGPYTIWVTAREVGKDGTDQYGPEPLAGGEYKQQLTYTSGLRIEIRVAVYGSSADQMWCTITDGPNVDAPPRRYKEAACLLTTSR